MGRPRSPGSGGPRKIDRSCVMCPATASSTRSRSHGSSKSKVLRRNRTKCVPFRSHCQLSDQRLETHHLVVVVEKRLVPFDRSKLRAVRTVDTLVAKILSDLGNLRDPA